MKFKNKQNLTQIIASCLLTFLFLSTSTSQGQTPLAANGQLKVDASTKKLVNECGKPVQLRGMSSHSLQDFDACYRANAAAYDALASWGTDVVRFANYVKEYLGLAPQGVVYTRTQWRTFMTNFVGQCETRGMYAIVDWHVLDPGNPLTYVTEAKEFFADMSLRLKDKKNVIYEICNEPNGCSWADVKSYANQVIPVIRANDPDAVILVGNPSWSSDLGSPLGDPLSFTNIMYTFHFYAASHMDKFSDFKDKSSKLPVFVSEWGTTEASGAGGISTSNAQQWVDFMNTNGISWCNWAFADKAESSSMLAVGSCSSKVFTNFTSQGNFVKNLLSSPADKFTKCDFGPECKAPNLGSDVSLCGVTGGVTLNSGLSATGKTFVWKNGTTVVPGSAPTLNVTTAGTYTVEIDSAGCKKSDAVVVSATMPTPTLATGIVLCNPATATLDAGVSGAALTYAWTLNNTTIGGNTKTLAINQAGTYKVTVSATGCTSTSASTSVTSSLPTLTGTGTICKGEAASIAAAGTGPFDWYTDPTAGTSVFTGATYTPSPTVTTTYYVGASGGVVSTFGPSNAGTAPWSLVAADYANADKQLVFTPSAAVTLVSVDVISATTQTVTVNVTDVATSTKVKTVTAQVSTSSGTIAIGASLTSGKSYRLDGVGTTGELTFRQNTAPSTQTAIYPQTIANVGTLTAANTDYALGWSLFYNVKVSKGGAGSCARAPFEVKVETCTGIEDEEATLASMRIYPNPFENGFTINLGANYGVTQRIEVTDIEGKLVDVKQGNAIANTTSMGEHLPNGQYFVRVISANKVVVKPVIKLK